MRPERTPASAPQLPPPSGPAQRVCRHPRLAPERARPGRFRAFFIRQSSRRRLARCRPIPSGGSTAGAAGFGAAAAGAAAALSRAQPVPWRAAAPRLPIGGAGQKYCRLCRFWARSELQAPVVPPERLSAPPAAARFADPAASSLRLPPGLHRPADPPFWLSQPRPLSFLLALTTRTTPVITLPETPFMVTIGPSDASPDAVVSAAAG